MTTITLPRATVEQALEVLLKSHTCPLLPDDCEEAITALRAALAQQAEPVRFLIEGNEFLGPPPAPYSTWGDALDSMIGARAIQGLRISALAQKPQPVQEICPGCEATLGAACGRESCPKGWGAAPQPQQPEPVEPVAWGWVGDPSTQDYASTQPDPVEPVGQLAELQAMLRAEVDRLIAAGIQPQRKPLTSDKDRPDQGATYVEGYGYVDTRAVRAVERARGIGEGERC